MKNRILWIARTGVLIALLIGAQAATAPLGNTLITGSIVNLILVLSVMPAGLSSGLSVALVSPVLARLFGIGPMYWTLIPFIALGNAALVLLWHLIGRRKIVKPVVAQGIAAVVAAAVKCGVLYLGVVKIAVPLLLKLEEPKATVISTMFSLPQLFTALIGGGAAVVLLPLLTRALRSTSISQSQA